MSRREFDGSPSALVPPAAAPAAGQRDVSARPGDAAPADRAGGRWLLRAAVTVVALGVLAIHVDRQKLLAELASLSLASIAAAALLIMLQALVAAERWHYLNNALGITVARLATLRIFMFSLLMGQVLPASIGADATRAFLIQRHSGSWKAALASVVLDRLIGLAVLAAIIVAGLPRLLTGWQSASLAELVGASAVILLAGSAAAIMVMAWAIRLVQRWPAMARIAPIMEAAAATFTAPSRMATLLALSVVNHGCSILTMYVLAKGLGANLALAAAVVFVPLILLASAVPISIAGWGVREGAALILLGQAGLSDAQALAVSVAYGAITLLPALIGGLIWLVGNDSAIRRPSS